MISSILENWISSKEALLWWIGWLSLALLAAGIILLPVVLVLLPEDYLFAKRSMGNPGPSKPKPPWYRGVRNLAGGVFVLAGIVMLVMPGQGLIPIVIGLAMMDFPRKQAFLRRLAGRKRVLRQSLRPFLKFVFIKTFMRRFRQ